MGRHKILSDHLRVGSGMCTKKFDHFLAKTRALTFALDIPPPAVPLPLCSAKGLSLTAFDCRQLSTFKVQNALISILHDDVGQFKICMTSAHPRCAGRNSRKLFCGLGTRRSPTFEYFSGQTPLQQSRSVYRYIGFGKSKSDPCRTLW